MFSTEDLLFLAPERSPLEFATGQFARRILVITPDEPGEPDRDGFLRKIFAAAQINLEQDALLASVPPGTPLSILPTLKAKQPAQVLVFGLSPKMLGLTLNVPVYQPFDFYGATFLFAEKLSLLEPDKARKAQLWRALQTLFL